MSSNQPPESPSSLFDDHSGSMNLKAKVKQKDIDKHSSTHVSRWILMGIHLGGQKFSRDAWVSLSTVKLHSGLL
ncbi:hypothetical protein PM082_011678 [Marasmius tenuissimus]|nr:hypothetical protein PM082_011678 [Marasmius tenuissimus]